jgi:hypothetical protein
MKQPAIIGIKPDDIIQRIMNIAFGVPVSFIGYPWWGMILFMN